MSTRRMTVFIFALLLIYVGYEISQHQDALKQTVSSGFDYVQHYFQPEPPQKHYLGEHGKSMYIPVKPVKPTENIIPFIPHR
jgi:hypothetical protein